MKTERFLSQEDAATLSRLAEHLLRLRDVNMNFAERLIDLIGTAILLPENVRMDDCVALYSKVTYREIGSDQHQSVVIVCPQDTQEALARVSILAPLAMSLLGRPAGSIVEVALPFDQVKFVEIVDVLPADYRAQEPHSGRAAAAR
jgi:regulator of nucleoside diphosphate kinase